MNEEETLALIRKALGDNCKILFPLLGGMMNQSLVVSNGKDEKFVAYFPTKQANEMVNRKIEKEALDIAQSLNITNQNVYFNIKTGIKINHYIEGVSLDKIDSFDYQSVADLLKKFHSSKVLSSVNYSPFVRFTDKYEKEAFAFQKNVDSQYKKLRDFLFLYQSFLESQKLALCHNDAQKSNIIKDEKNRYYLIDYEFAGNNDPIYDIATFGNGKVEEGRTLLNHYFNGQVTKEQIQRYYLWRIFISLQWYNVAITKHYRGEGAIHHINFLDVANFFLKNAQTAFIGYEKEIKA